MSPALQRSVVLENRFARKFPELSISWAADEPPAPRLLVLNGRLARELGLDPEYLRSEKGIAVLTGAHPPDGATPVAQGYAGHQFGSYSPRLGDGRALLLGELRDADSRLRDLHLKGSGRTPFSRGGDGFGAVGPMLREYILSESMHALGIPTTLSLAVTATGHDVLRESRLPGAVLTRVASSHLRVGSFQYARALDDPELLQRLADEAIERHHPQAADTERPYLALFHAVVADQATLIAQWMLVGFVHGVMNTDNMTISGETIDYGPCAFIDAFDPAAVFSSIDAQGRYAYRNQPVMAEWNLARLAEAMLPLFDDDEDRAVELAMESLRTFRTRYSEAWSAGMFEKLGLPPATDVESQDQPAHDVVHATTDLLAAGAADYTSFFRALADVARGERESARALFADPAPFDDWADTWLALGPDAARMDRINPAYIPRNHLVEEALQAATGGDLEPLNRLLEAVSAPYDVRPGLERYAADAPTEFGPYVTFCGT
ncbi:protein adenylyltransferase SelO [Arthrobacter rhombi]|uniref:protein adenylyltransferase SelO n=1 Tax=Arthrobacter rhombi TaxID=71253 RepID=UPI003FD30B08